MSETPFRVLVLGELFEPGSRGGGPIRSLAHLMDTVPPGITVDLVTRDRDLGDTTPFPGLSGTWVQRSPQVRVHYWDPRSRRGSARLLRDLRAARYDLLYTNSLWATTFSMLPIVLARTGVLRAARLLLAPRGELSPGALGLKSGKKRAVAAVWRPFLALARVRWHATSVVEAEHIADFARGADVVHNDNESPLPAVATGPREPSGDRVRLLFVSRIHPKKNVLLVLQALRDLEVPAELTIAGPVEDERYWDRCREVIAALPEHVDVRFVGPVAYTEVAGLFGAADAFVFPTLGENYGHVVLESLAASCPVVVSAETPWDDLVLAGAGTILPDLSVATLTGVLAERCARPADRRQADRRAAGQAYDTWKRTVPTEHLFAQVRAGRSRPAS